MTEPVQRRIAELLRLDGAIDWPDEFNGILDREGLNDLWNEVSQKCNATAQQPLNGDADEWERHQTLNTNRNVMFLSRLGLLELAKEHAVPA